MTASPDQPSPDQASLSTILRNRSAVAFLAAVFLITVGVAAQVTALGKQVFDLTRRELDLGLIGLFEFLPAALLVVVTGAVADRFDRRRVAAIGLSGEALAMVGLAAFTLADRPDLGVGPLFGCVLLFGIFRAFAAPATRAMPASIVAPAALPRVIALNSTMWQLGLILGPILGGLMFSWRPASPYLLAAACWLAGAVLLRSITWHTAPPPAARAAGPANAWREALQGLRAIRARPVLLGAISLDLFAVLFGGAIALLPAIVTTRFGIAEPDQAAALGLLRAAVGVGAGLVTIALVVRPITRHVGRWLFIAVGAFGVAHIALGLTRTYWVAFACLLIGSAFDALSVFIRATLLPMVTPDAIRGRVLAVEAVFIGASNELGAFESGVAGEIFGAPGAIALGGVVTLVVVAIWSVAFPALARIDRFPITPVEAPPVGDPGAMP